MGDPFCERQAGFFRSQTRESRHSPTFCARLGRDRANATRAHDLRWITAIRPQLVDVAVAAKEHYVALTFREQFPPLRILMA
jgi:hypothetical protein